MTTVGDIMSSTLVRVAPSATLAEAATVMGEHRVGSALVMEGDTLVGIFTERDVLRALSDHFDAPTHLVSDWMTRSPATVGPGTALQEALARMLQGGFRHLPVVKGGTVIGVVSIRDLAQAQASGEA